MEPACSFFGFFVHIAWPGGSGFCRFFFCVSSLQLKLFVKCILLLSGQVAGSGEY